jgi:hypothetical protein
VSEAEARGEARNASRAGDAAVAELEAIVAEAEARGEPVPPEAHAMLARLGELVDALHGLSATFDDRPDGAAAPEASTKEEEQP